MRILDEVADAVQIAHKRRPRPVLLSVKLEDQFDGLAVMAANWQRMERHLACTLPPLEFDQGHWWLPDGLVTIWDLCKCVASQHVDWEQPDEKTSAAWKNAQIFARVRHTLVEVGNLYPEQVVREARLQRDLRLE
jgi:hypothetical protein